MASASLALLIAPSARASAMRSASPTRRVGGCVSDPSWPASARRSAVDTLSTEKRGANVILSVTGASSAPTLVFLCHSVTTIESSPISCSLRACHTLRLRLDQNTLPYGLLSAPTPALALLTWARIIEVTSSCLRP